MPKLEKWSVVGDTYKISPYGKISVKGIVYGHPTLTDGKRVRTSDIVSTDGKTIKTKSGSVYTLGEPDPKYVEWVRTTLKQEIDPEHPIKFVDKSLN